MILIVQHGELMSSVASNVICIKTSGTPGEKKLFVLSRNYQKQNHYGFSVWIIGVKILFSFTLIILPYLVLILIYYCHVYQETVKNST